VTYENIQERKVENENRMKTLKKTMDSRALELEELRKEFQPLLEELKAAVERDATRHETEQFLETSNAQYKELRSRVQQLSASEHGHERYFLAGRMCTMHLFMALTVRIAFQLCRWLFRFGEVNYW
jgi:hypothetical protein